MFNCSVIKQGYRYHKIRKAFSKFYQRHSELIVKYNIGLKTLLQQGISEPIFYVDLGYKEALAIRRVLSLVDIFTNTKFSSSTLVFKIGAVWQQNMQSKHQNTFQSNLSLAKQYLRFLLPPLILRLSTLCRRDQTLSKCFASYQKF